MTGTAILWSHALAALLFGVLALVQLRSRAANLPRAAFLIALVMSGLWALAEAGIGPVERARPQDHLVLDQRHIDEAADGEAVSPVGGVRA